MSSTPTLNLVLTYFHAFYGPKVLISHPERVPDDIKKVISGFFFNLDMNNPFFEVTLVEEDLKITNLYFEIPSVWARGNREMVMISVITKKNFKSEFFYDLLTEYSEKIKSSINMYKSLYAQDQQKQDKEVEVKYQELHKLFDEVVGMFNKKREETEILELLATKKLTLSGAYRVFGTLLTDIISCLLQKKIVILSGDRDASVALYGIVNRIFLDIFPVEDKIKVVKKSPEPNRESLIINTGLRLLEYGEICQDSHNAINRYLQDAEKMGDNEAAIISLRQKISILIQIADLLEKILIKKENEKQLINDINNHLRIKVKSDDLEAVKMILKVRGKNEVAERITVSKMSKF